MKTFWNYRNSAFCNRCMATTYAKYQRHAQRMRLADPDHAYKLTCRCGDTIDGAYGETEVNAGARAAMGANTWVPVETIQFA